MSSMGLIEESYPARIAAVVNNPLQADETVTRLVTEAAIPRAQIVVVKPMDVAFGRKLEPESQGIARTAINAHLKLGVIGLFTGVALAVLLIAIDVEMASANPAYTLSAFGVFLTLFGLLLGGLVTARPDHQVVIAGVREASEEGRWTVVVHAANEEQVRRARRLLDGEPARVMAAR